jgi:ComF family protein
VKTSIQKALSTVTDLLFPPRCVHCSSNGSLFCARCVADSPLLAEITTCRRCALPAPGDICDACFTKPPPLDLSLAVFAYDSPIRDAVTAFKYNDIRALAPVLAGFMNERLPERVKQEVSVVIPVPMAAARLRSRGYNQAELLARRLCNASLMDMASGLLTRANSTNQQAHAGSLEQRAENVKEAFTASSDAEDLRILLVDDVMTTGSTLNACARALKTAGAVWVGALVLAREL